MDHLLKMKYATYQDMEIPYLCEDLSYSEPFENCPERLGFTRSDLVDAVDSDRPAAEVDKVLQAWLFFGLLQTFFGSLFEPKQFIRHNSSGECVISTQRLRRITAYFRAKRPDRSDPEWNEEWKGLRQHLVHAKAILMEREENGKARGIVQTPTQLLVAVLIQFLAKNLGMPNEGRRSKNLENGLVEQTMIERGWCPRQVAFLTECLHVESLYLISLIERPDSSLQHSEACEVDCVANQVDEETYETKHVCPDSSCPFVAADQGEMFDMLKAGHLPLVLNQDHGGRHEIEMTDTLQSEKFVAISHVWSHGLGNPKDNSLPQCQLNRLNELVSNLYPAEQESVPYWIDTICCPINPKEARSLAIMNMRKTYKEADKVLVLDANLEKIDSSSLFVAEIALRIICSTWLTRLWTLQEGALAPTIYFQFADRAIDVETLELSLRRDASCKEFVDLLGAFINFRRADQNGMGLPASAIIQFLNASVRNRSTSRASDEAICLASLVGMDMRSIARFSGENRMYNFWRLLKPTPSLMAFWNGPRLATPGWRWAPATLRANVNLDLDLRKAFDEEENGEEAAITERGLMLKAPGLLINPQGMLPLGEQFLIASPSENQWFHVCKAGPFPGNAGQSHSETRPTTIEGNDCGQLALILKRGRRLELAKYDESAIDHVALLVDIGRDEPGRVIYAGYMCNVSLNPISPDGLGDPREFTGPAVVSASTTPDHLRSGDLISDSKKRLSASRARATATAAQFALSTSVTDSTGRLPRLEPLVEDVARDRQPPSEVRENGIIPAFAGSQSLPDTQEWCLG